MADTDTPTPAATVIILRDTPQGPPEFLMTHRAQTMGFAGGAYVFPGGKVDPADVPTGPAFVGFADLDATDASGRIAAAREAFEEAGILLSSGPPVAAHDRLAWRDRLVDHQASFADALAAFDHHLDAAMLKPFANWIPPMGLHRRFDTLFYIARLPAGEEALHDGNETQAVEWVTASGVLAARDEGRVELIFPTRCNVERLGQFTSADTLWNDPTPVVRVQPEVVDRNGIPMLKIPDGIGYPITERPLHGERRA